MTKNINVAFFADINDNHNQKWLEQLVKKINCIVITLENNPLKDNRFSESTNIKVFPVLPTTYSLKQLLNLRSTKNKITAILEKEKIHVIHSIYSSPYSLWADLFQKNNHIISTYGSDILIDYQKVWQKPQNLKQSFSFYFLRTMTERAFNKASIITSTSQNQQIIIRQFINDKSKLFITRTGVDCNFFTENLTASKTEKSNYTILSNRAMRPLYNIDIIIDAFLLFIKKRELKDCKLILLNYNTDESYLEWINKKIIQNQASNSIQIINDLAFKDLIKLYQRSNLTVMIPSSDGTPVSGVEVLLAQTPLIMGNLNYDSDLFNENTTWFINEISSISLSEKFNELYNCNSEELNKKMGNGYQAAIKNANLDLEIAKLLSFYKQIARGNG